MCIMLAARAGLQYRAHTGQLVPLVGKVALHARSGPCIARGAMASHRRYKGMAII